MAGSRSASLPALTTINSFPIARAAFGIRCNVTPTLGLFKLTRKPITDAFGTSWLSSSSRFPPRSTVSIAIPVMLPPGRLRPATKPSLTGSPPTPVNTIGIELAAFAATAATVVPETKTLTGRATSSRASREDDHNHLPPSDIRSQHFGLRYSPPPSIQRERRPTYL
jgi:hypothetical protein